MTAPVMTAVKAYIAMRHGLGYRSPTQERSLRAFARHLDTANHSGPISLASTVQWATATTSIDPCNPARRLATVRGFLRHFSALEGATEAPPPGLLGPTGHRKPPHVYTDDEIAALLGTAAGLAPSAGCAPAVMSPCSASWLAPDFASARRSPCHAPMSTSTPA